MGQALNKSSLIEQQIALLEAGDLQVAPVEEVPVEDIPHNQAPSKYLGVYHNPNATAAQKPYRAAICRFKGQPNQKWVNLGYFDCEHVAATAYNVASINYFNGKGMLNPVNVDLRDAKEYNAFKTKRQEFVVKAAQQLTANQAANIPTKHWELR